MFLCPGDQHVRAAIFSQHNYDRLINCTAGECEFETAIQVQYMLTYWVHSTCLVVGEGNVMIYFIGNDRLVKCAIGEGEFETSTQV